MSGKGGERPGLKYVLAGAAGAAVLTGLLGSTRIRFLDRDRLDSVRRTGPAIVALWHGDLLGPTFSYRHSGFATMASRSGDGEYIARMLHHWGYRVARGSSSRGGDVALRELATLVKQGYSAALTADGPRGPRHRLKPGVLRLSQMTGAPVVPVGSAASPAWRLGSWDRFTVPRPFGRIVIAIGEARRVDPELDGDGLKAAAAAMEAEMAALGEAAERALSGGAPPS